MFSIVDGTWLANYDESVKELKLTKLDEPIEHAYSGTAALEDIKSLFSNPDKEPDLGVNVNISVKLPSDEQSVDIIFIKKLANGLELKPYEVHLTRTQKFTLSTQIIDLVSAYTKQNSTLQQVNAELEKTQKVLHEVVDEKNKYQDVVLKRVYAMLAERNAWLEKFQGIKPESPN